MIMQYDDMVLQVVERLKKAIPDRVAPVALKMVNSQEDLEAFYLSAEKPKIMVTWSGMTAEGGREAKDFVKSMSDNDQYEGHTIEVHVCAKRFMYEAGALNDSILKLVWIVRRALTGLSFYPRDTTGAVVKYDDYGVSQAQTNGMFHMETLIDRQYKGVIVGIVRMQVLEMITIDEEINPDMIWGVYKDIILQEYRGTAGGDPIQTTGTADETVHIN